jgi:hypothetical protein
MNLRHSSETGIDSIDDSSILRGLGEAGSEKPKQGYFALFGRNWI